jgi:hypothetical protein
VEPGIGQSQGVGGYSEGLCPNENHVAYSECKDRRSFFVQTADNVGLERSSHLQDMLLTGNDADFE